jgi:hypothetical protein
LNHFLGSHSGLSFIDQDPFRPTRISILYFFPTVFFISAESGSQQSIYDFNECELKRTSVFYSDASCETEKERMIEDFNFRLIDKEATIDGDEVKQIDFIYNSASLIPRTTDRADQLNSSVYCDYDDWVVDETRELLGQSNCMDLNLDDVVYDTYLVLDTDLYLGETPADTQEGRPITLGDTAIASYFGDIPETE